MSFKKTAPDAAAENKFFLANGFGGFDFALVAPWPLTFPAAKLVEGLMQRVKRGGLDYFAYRASSHGSSSNRDAQVVIKVRDVIGRLVGLARKSMSGAKGGTP